MLAQKRCEPRFCDLAMFGVQAFPNFFLVAEHAGILATGLVTYEILHFGFFPRLVRRLVRSLFHRFLPFCTVTVENDREEAKQESFEGCYFPSYTGL